MRQATEIELWVCDQALACRAHNRWDPVWSLGDGLQGILSSTGQVQCGQVHCRLPYTAPPVHLKADMDGPLSSRGEKVNGAWLCLVGQSLPAGNGFLAVFPVTEWVPCHAMADHSGPPVCPQGSHQSSLTSLKSPCSPVLPTYWSEAFLFTFLEIIHVCGSGEGFYPTPLHFPFHIPFFYSFPSVGSN